MIMAMLLCALKKGMYYVGRYIISSNIKKKRFPIISLGIQNNKNYLFIYELNAGGAQLTYFV